MKSGNPLRAIPLSALLVALGLLLLGNYSAIAADAQGAAKAPAAKRFGVVWLIRGQVTVDRGNANNPRRLRSGDAVLVGDTVRSSASGEAVIRTDDAGMVAVRPGAEFVPESFAADGLSTDHQSVRLIIGSLRVISGWIGHVNQPAHRIVMPMVTIGIRGTDYEPYVLSAELAAARSEQEGAYTKVNRGSTELDPDGQARRQTTAPRRCAARHSRKSRTARSRQRQRSPRWYAAVATGRNPARAD